MVRAVFLALLCAGLQPGILFGQNSEAAIDRMFANYAGNVPSASVGVFKQGQIIFSKSYGKRDLESGDDASPSTNYRLASLSKAFTALALVMLSERGLVEYDRSIVDYISFPRYGERITIRHLLNHQSGLKDYEQLIPSSQSEQITDHGVVDILRRQRSTYFVPGTQYRYSNSGYAVLAVIVEAVSGQQFPEFLRSEIFSPLGMNKSVAFVNGANSVAERAFGYTGYGRTFQRTDQSLTSAVLGDGGVYSSILDLFLWDQSFYPDNALVSEDSLRDVFTPGRLSNGRRTQYGFGWVIDSYRNSLRISHTGSTIGQRSAIQRFPEKQLTVVVLMNRANVSPWESARQIADMYWD